MPEFFLSSTLKKNEFSTLHLSDLFHVCFSIFSHPIYFSYFIFFSPLLLRLLSFLSPLFVTTTLLLLALLTLSPKLVQNNEDSEFSECNSKLGFLLSVNQTPVEWLRSSGGDKYEEFGFTEAFEAYLVMFQASIFDVVQPETEENGPEDYFEGQDAELSGKGRDHVAEMEDSNGNSDGKQNEKDEKVEAPRPIAEMKSLKSFLQENTGLEELSCQNEDREIKALDPEFDKVEEGKGRLPLRSGSKVESNRNIDAKVNEDRDGEYAEAVKVNSQRLEATLGSPENNWVYTGKVMGNNQTLGSTLGSYGSMRREKEWRRTLACKLFEERHNADETERMDLLWETYESESNKQVEEKGSRKKVTKTETEHSEFNEEEEDMEGKLCCLQALKLSAGKMHLGMGRPNLLKISKALKGIGWLNHVSRHGKKGYH